VRNSYSDTIAAIATPLGEGGIGIVRLSGSQAVSIAARIFRSSPRRNINELPSHSLHYGQVVSRTKPIDEGLLAIMRAPNSYTREDVVEIQAHGGPIPLEKILRLVIEEGARPAEPGEFTRRAFLNGRMDLVQAEAVADLIRARTEGAYEIALGQLSGRFSAKVKDLRQRLIKCLTIIEASIDFPEESGLGPGKSFQKTLRLLGDELLKLEEGAEKGRIIREGIRAVIIGRPNVGKSSLMNALLKEKRVIVTHIPGTTRDVVEEIVNIEGIPLRIADTAGLRKTRKLIEIQGVAQSRSYLDKADLVIIVLDGHQKLKKEDLDIIKLVKEKGKKAIAAVNKSDLPIRLEMPRLKRHFPAGMTVRISAKCLAGISNFNRKIAPALGIKKPGNGSENILASRLRHQISLGNARSNVHNALLAWQNGLSAEFIAFDLWQSVEALDEILGLNYKEDLLDKIFREFCIGK